MAMIMTLRYKTNDGTEHVVKGVRRAFADTEEEFLLRYETIADGIGVGARMADILWWMVHWEPAPAGLEL